MFRHLKLLLHLHRHYPKPPAGRVNGGSPSECRRQRAEQNDIERRLRLVALMKCLVGGDVDSTQVLCFDRLSAVFSQVCGEGDECPSHRSKLLPALNDFIWRTKKAVLQTVKNKCPRERKHVVCVHSMDP